jgi:microcystin-dependent protein
MRESTAARLTATYFGGNSTLLGAVGGGESNVLGTANLPPYTPSGSISNGAISINHNANLFNSASFVAGGGNPIPSPASATITASQAASSFFGNSQGGTSTPFRIVQPSIVCNYIIRIV